MTSRFTSWIRSLVGSTGTTAVAAKDWPSLPSQGFVSGKPATEADVAVGNAIFVAKVEGEPIGTPLAIPIPQYAHLADKAGAAIRVIVVQAEAANDIRLFGVRDLSGKEYVVQESDLTLLGNGRPE